MIARRNFLATLPAGAAALAQTNQRRFDLLIRNGTLLDPARSLNRKQDLAILDGNIAAIEDSIPADRAIEIMDATGLYVTPGLVDLHTHCYHSATGLGIEADPIAARSGVTTWVDAGSFGYDQAAGFRRFIVQPAHARIYGYVYLYPSSRNPDIDVLRYVRSGLDRTGRTVADNRDILLGIKMQVGANMNGKYSLDMLKMAREVCDKYKIPLMAHISFAPPETSEVMELMRPGDVVTHAYNGHTLGIISQDGKLKPGVAEARARGVWFDLGHGLGSFNFPAARKCMEAGFLCDTISTDIYNLNVRGPVYDMTTTMSKLLHLGMGFPEIVLRTTATPARIVNRLQGMGTLTVGGPADVALLALEDGEFRLVDSQKNVEVAKRRIVCRATICRGRKMVAV
jgi:dihydroorotase